MTKDLTKGAPFRVIILYMIPVFFRLLLQNFYSIADTVIVGQALGADALGGVSSTGNLLLMTLGACLGLAGGFCIPIANAFGAGDHPQLRKCVVNGAYLSAVAVILVMVSCFPNSRALLTLMQTPEENFPHALAYLQIIFLGMPCRMLYNYCAAIVSSLGDSKMPLVFLAISAVINIVLDLLFILTFHMGAAGAALATVISEGIAGVCCLIYMAKKITILRLSPGELVPSRRHISLLLRNGVPMALQNILLFLSGVIMQIALNTLGALYVNAIAVAGKVGALLDCPLHTIANTFGVYYSQNVGAQKPDRIRQGYRIGLILTVAFCSFTVILALLFTPQLTALFLQNPGQDLLTLVKEYLLICCSTSVLLGVIFTYRPAIQAMGLPSVVTLATIGELVLRVAAAVFLVPVWGFTGVCLSNTAGWIIPPMILVPMGYRCLKKLQERCEQQRMGL